MKVTKIEEQSFEELDNEEQIAYLKNELFEFATRVVVAVGIAILGIWYGSNTKPHSYFSEYSGEVVQVTTPNIVLFTIGIFVVSGIIGQSAYKKRERILDAVRLIQGGDDDE